MAALHWAAAAAGTLGESWKADAVVYGRVLEYLSETQLIAEIAGVKVQAVVPSPGRIPRQFVARVRDNGASPTLELMGEAADGPRVAAAVRGRLPNQSGLPPVLADLHALARTGAARSLPPHVREAVARLEASIADHRDLLDADVLRDTMLRAGVQLEHAVSRVAHATHPVSTIPIDYDIKAALERLVHALNDAREAMPPSPSATLLPADEGNEAPPPPLLQLPLQPQARAPAPSFTDTTALAGAMLNHAQAALARIEIMQLQAHPAASPNACMLEIPVRGKDGFDVLQVRIDEDERDPDAAPSDAMANWTLEFTLELPALGPVQGQIRLHGTNVSVDLWAQHDATVQALEDQNAALPRLLQMLGLQLVQLRTRRGMPARRTGIGRTLLDTRA